MRSITVVGGGFAGLVAAVTCAEAGARVRLFESHHGLGGRGRATAPPYVAHDGPHVLYSDGPWWRWLVDRDLVGLSAGLPLSGLGGFRFRHRDRLRRTPPIGLAAVLRHRRRRAPIDLFATWIRRQHGEQAALAASNLMGVATFDAAPGRLSAAFVWERLLRVFAPRPPARYVLGGWNGLVDRLAAHARTVGVSIETGARVTEIPPPPAIVATSLEAAGRLLGTTLPPVESGRTTLLDLAVRRDRRDAFVVSDLDAAGWLERYTLPDPSLAPPGESLIQAHLPLRDGETAPAGHARLETLVQQALPGWRDRTTWRRSGVAHRRSGALDLPGHTWRDRPAIARGDDIFLAGDMVAAPGLLSEVSFHSGLAAARGALGEPATR
jgi:hypothetical protein